MGLTKERKNAPCPCGSGRKYKKCCFGKEGKEPMVAKNDFRAEVERQRMSPQDQIKQDQQVMLLRLRLQRELLSASRRMAQEQLHRIVTCRNAMLALGFEFPSDAPPIKELDMQIGAWEKARDGAQMSKGDEIFLATLEQIQPTCPPPVEEAEDITDLREDNPKRQSEGLRNLEQACRTPGWLKGKLEKRDEDKPVGPPIKV